MKYVSVEEILALHDYQIHRFGGTPGLLNLPLLESSLSRPLTNISGVDMYNSIYEKAAVLCISIIRNHPFIDGNKRTGLHASLTFLELNGFHTDFTQRELVKLGMDISENRLELEEVCMKFKKNSKLE